MPFTIVRYETTPNPNALKCILDRPISAGPRSFLNAAMAAGDPLAAALFREAPITTLLMNGGWMTINKKPDVEWRSVKPKVERVLAAAPAATPDAPVAASEH